LPVRSSGRSSSVLNLGTCPSFETRLRRAQPLLRMSGHFQTPLVVRRD
jgi:hypothetical protein